MPLSLKTQGIFAEYTLDLHLRFLPRRKWLCLPLPGLCWPHFWPLQLVCLLLRLITPSTTSGLSMISCTQSVLNKFHLKIANILIRRALPVSEMETRPPCLPPCGYKCLWVRGKRKETLAFVPGPPWHAPKKSYLRMFFGVYWDLCGHRSNLILW